MTTRFCLLAFLMFFIYSAYAGSRDEFQLRVLDTIKDYTLFNQVRVVDMRADKDNIGYLRNGPFNKKNVQVPSGGLERMLQDFAQSTAGQPASKGDKTLLVLVRDFTMADRPIEGEMGTFYARIDFYLGSGDRFQLADHVDSFYETANTWDVTANIKKLASRKMTDWLLYMAHYPINSATAPAVLSLADIQAAIAKEREAYPVYKDAPQPGIYYTLEQFLHNTPGTADFIEKKYSVGDRNISYFYEKGEGKKKGASLDKTSCFAVYNGKKWFKKTSNGLLEMKFKNGDFYFPEVGYGIRKSDNAAIMFGLIGALADANNAKGNALYRMRLDPLTGNGSSTERLQ